MSSDAPIPVTVLTGFLGAGKTTLLNRILTENHGRKLAVIENEFGELGVDHQLVIQSDEEIFEMNNGCLCCSVRGDLIRILGRLMKRRDRLDGILIETTGLADPGPVAQTFFTDEEMRARFRLDAIVTVVDAKHVEQHIDSSPEVKKQIGFADVLVLNKTDLVAPAALDALESRIRKMNAAARVHRAQNCALDLKHVLDVGGFNLSRATELNPSFLQPDYPFEWAGIYDLPAGRLDLVIGHSDDDHHDHSHCDHDHGHEGHHHHHHGNENELDVVIMPVKRPADGNFESPEALTSIASATEATVLVFADWENRVKNGDPIAPGGTLHRLLLDEGHGRYPLEIAHPGLYMVFEGCGEEPLHLYPAGSDDNFRPVWQHDYPHSHHHDEDVSSVGITFPGELDGRRLNDWIGPLLQTKGADIYRCKGVLAIKGSEKRLVFQGVHMLFDAKFDTPWNGQPKQNTLVFIGKNLDRQSLTASAQACLA